MRGGERRHRLASDSILSWTGMTAKEVRLEDFLRLGVSAISAPPPARMGLKGRGGYRNHEDLGRVSKLRMVIPLPFGFGSKTHLYS